MVSHILIPRDLCKTPGIDKTTYYQQGGQIDIFYFFAPNAFAGLLATDWKFDVPIILPKAYSSVYLVTAAKTWGATAGIQCALSFAPLFPGKPQTTPVTNPLLGNEKLFAIASGDGANPHTEFIKFRNPLPLQLYLTYGPTGGGSTALATALTLGFTDDIDYWVGNMGVPGAGT